MKWIRFFIIFSFFSSSCLAALDDTLPKGVSSRTLAFPFIIRSPETSWGFGGAGAFFFKSKKDDDKIRTSDINLLFLYTLREQTVIVIGSTIFFPEEKGIFRFQGSFSNYPDKFWGLGNDATNNTKEDYSLKQVFFNPQYIIKLYKNLFIGASFELQNVTDFSYLDGGVFDSQKIKGTNGGLTSGAGILFTWDTRNNSYSPSHGVFAEVNMTRFTKQFGSNFDFSSYMVDIRKFMPTGRNRVLAFQALAKANHGPTPFRYLSMLGGTEMMRGLYKGRYSDQNMFAIQSEIRQYLFWRFGLAGFVSAGQVSNHFNNFGLSDFHYAYGLGLRLVLQEKEKLNLRVDFGFSKKSSGIYVILKEAF